MRVKFINAISSGDFYSAKQILQAIPSETVINFLIDLAFETNLVGIYSFVLFLLLEKESVFFHDIAIGILSVSMWEGANAAAFLHARRVVELSPMDIKQQEHLLTYLGTPDCIMSYEEAINIANEILAQDPTNNTALNTIARITIKTKHNAQPK